MDSNQILIGSMAFFVGLLAILASALNWRHFIYYGESWGTDLPSFIGETGTRIFYGLLGIAVLVIGVLILTEMIDVSSQDEGAQSTSQIETTYRLPTA